MKELSCLVTFCLMVTMACGQQTDSIKTDESYPVHKKITTRSAIRLDQEAIGLRPPGKGPGKVGYTIQKAGGIVLTAGGTGLLTYMTFFAEKPVDDSGLLSGLDEFVYGAGFFFGTAALVGGIKMIKVSSRKLRVIKDRSSVYLTPVGAGIAYRF